MHLQKSVQLLGCISVLPSFLFYRIKKFPCKEQGIFFKKLCILL